MSTIEHVTHLAEALRRAGPAWQQADAWGRELADRLPRGHTLLVAGNGGSAAQAQHFSAEIVGRYAGDRRPFSSISLHTDTSAVTAIVNDYGAEEMFARQVEAHGRPGDVLLLMSTSGRSPNLLRAAERARRCGVTAWAMTGPAPNPLAALAERALCVDAATTATVQELHLVSLHIVCEVFDETLAARRRAFDGDASAAGLDRAVAL